MKIVEIYIYGYGKLQNVKLTNLADFQIFYGENEAGKSTIMSFIHSILFGFPTKNQVELRYEPKDGSKYGGKLTVDFSGKGIAEIERVKGKAAGDVTILLDRGARSGGEELLQELMSSVDKALFQSVFSFNLHGLQNVQKMKGEDLGRFLFSAGIVGTERLALTETVLQKEMENRFKPNGKKPLINVKLQELREQYVELKKAEQQNAEYWTYVEQHSELLEKMKEISLHMEELQRKIAKDSEIERLLPLIQEEEQIVKELNSIGPLEFPEDGMQRMESLSEMIKPLQARIHALNERVVGVEKEIIELSPNFRLVNQETYILSVVDEVPKVNQFLEDKSVVERKKAELNDEIQRLSEKLNLKMVEDDIAQINTSVFMKEKIEELKSNQERLREKKSELEQSFQSEKNLLETLEGSLHSVKNLLLSEHEREKLDEQLKVFQHQDVLRKELVDIQDRLRFLKMNQQQMKQNRKKQGLFQFMLLGSLFAFLSVYGVLRGELLFVVIGIAAILSLALLKFFIPFKKDGVEWEKEINELQEKEKELNLKTENVSSMNGEMLKERYSRDSQLRDEYKQLVFKVEQQTARYEKVISDFESWETKWVENNGRLIEAGKELKLSEQISLRHIKEAFELLESLKMLYRERGRVQNRLEEINAYISEVRIKVNRLTSDLFELEFSTIQEAALVLRKSLREEKDKKIVHEEKMNKLAELKEELNLHVSEKNHLVAQLRKLFELAKVETEEQFRNQAKKAERQLKLSERLADIQIQLHVTDDEKREAKLNPLEKRSRQHQEKLDELQKEYKKYQEKEASIKYKMSILEEGGLYADLLHKYKQAKFEFEEEAKTWTRYAVAKDILTKTIERYKLERLPQMLETAGGYLQTLTDGNYCRLHTRFDTDGFSVERHDGRFFEANELSQATAEQVYLSIRLALTTTIYKHFSMPIIIDDSFVNFDHIRMRKVIELLQKQDEDHQILFFTCHKHLLTLFNRAHIIDLSQAAGGSVKIS